jgi:ribosomal protein S4
MRRRNARKRRYRDSFYNKQQLRLFYGKIKETRFRSFYKKYLINSVNRNRSFFASLERRIDTIFFRSRLLPTIFACNQYIHHYGLRVNNKLEYSPHILLNPGDIISISKTH